MKREIYKVYAEVIDAKGSPITIKGYPKIFKSEDYDGDLEQTLDEANGELFDLLSNMRKHKDRQLQIAYIVRLSDGQQIEMRKIGHLEDLPDEEGGE